MIDKLLNPLRALVERGQPRLALKEAKNQIGIFLSFISSLYDSGHLNDENLWSYLKMAVLINPSAGSYGNLIAYYNKKGFTSEALNAWSEAKMVLGKDEYTSDLWYNIGCVFMSMGLLKEASEHFRESIKLNFDFPMAHYQLSSVLMALGEYKEGLDEDQWRFKAHSQLKRFRKRFKAPDWQGSGRVLVFSEQGLGDAILCARYLKNLKEAGCKVILEIQNELVDLFKHHVWVDEVYGRENTDYITKVVPDDAYDCVISINSLPCYFDPDLISPSADRYLKVDPCQSLSDFKVGLVWAGSRFHSNDKHRSCYLKDLSAIFEVEGVHLYNFQQGDMHRTWCRGNSTLWDGDDNFDLVNLNEGAEHLLEKMSNPISECKNFYETALILKQMNLLITVDTALAHLAGAMGVPTWLMLPHAHEWRWRRSWYKSMVYYKKDKVDSWFDLAHVIAQDLKIIKNSFFPY